MKLLEVKNQLKPVAKLVRKIHETRDLSRSDKFFKESLCRILPSIHSLFVREQVRLCFLVGPNSPEKSNQTVQQRRILIQLICGLVYDHRCLGCGKHLGEKARSFLPKAYVGHKSCSSKCSANSDNTRQKIVATCIERYGVGVPSQAKSIQKKMKATLLKRYQVSNISQIPSVKTKKILTLRSNYGVDNPSQSKEIQDRKIQTWINNYGVDNPNKSEVVKAKTRKTNMIKYGMESTGGHPERIKKLKHTYWSKSKRVRRKMVTKRKETMMSRYGVTNMMKDEKFARSVMQNSAYSKQLKIGKYQFLGLQGYEPQALKFLINVQGIDPDRIKTGDQVEGQFKYNLKGKTHDYYPDFKIGNRLYVEVKGTLTLGLISLGDKAKTRGTLLTFKRKLQAVESQGFRIYGMVKIGRQWLVVPNSNFYRYQIHKGIKDLKSDPTIPFLLVGGQ